MNHATVTRDGFTVPLIGIPKDATLQECDACHELFGLQQIQWTGAQMLCDKCGKEPVTP
jgi:hypothetical protein